jgi:hypothetical protein
MGYGSSGKAVGLARKEMKRRRTKNEQQAIFALTSGMVGDMDSCASTVPEEPKGLELDTPDCLYSNNKSNRDRGVNALKGLA